MKKRLLYGSAIVLLVLSVLLVVWQGSFKLGQFGPTNPHQTLVFWAMSSLIFILIVTLGFILFREAVKLYVERQKNREGSRIKTKLVVGALTLTIVPVFFLFWFSYEVTALPEAREPVYAPHFWRDVFEVENEWCGRIRAFAGTVQPSTRGERVWLRGFGPYRVEPPQPWSWVKRLWSRLRRLS